MSVAKVWIEDGCISCSLCQDVCPDVFLVEDGEECTIKPDAARHFLAQDEDIRLAAEDCPVEVIKFDETETPAEVERAPT